MFNRSIWCAGLSFSGFQHQSSSKVSPWKAGGLKQEEEEIQVIESENEEEEVLVDDFDGQCCRTYPYNHSKIQRWKEAREKKEKDKKETKNMHLSNVQNIKTPTSNPEKAIISNKQTEAITTTAGKLFFIHYSMRFAFESSSESKIMLYFLNKQTKRLPRPKQ